MIFYQQPLSMPEEDLASLDDISFRWSTPFGLFLSLVLFDRYDGYGWYWSFEYKKDPSQCSWSHYSMEGIPLRNLAWPEIVSRAQAAQWFKGEMEDFMIKSPLTVISLNGESATPVTIIRLIDEFLKDQSIEG